MMLSQIRLRLLVSSEYLYGHPMSVYRLIRKLAAFSVAWTVMLFVAYPLAF